LTFGPRFRGRSILWVPASNPWTKSSFPTGRPVRVAARIRSSRSAFSTPCSNVSRHCPWFHCRLHSLMSIIPVRSTPVVCAAALDHRPIRRSAYQPRPHRVQFHVPQSLPAMAFVQRIRVKPILPHVPGFSKPDVVPTCIVRMCPTEGMRQTAGECGIASRCT